MRATHRESYGSVRTPEYAAWVNMIQRCENASLRDYHRYGGRGVRVCEQWRNSFEAFLADVGRRPSSGHSLDRYPNPDGNYEPGNVRWATETQQQQNRSDNRVIEAFGERMCLAEWSRKTGIKRETIARRLNAGESPERALATDPRFKLYEFNGETLTVSAIAKRVGVPANSLLRRVRRHGDIHDAIEAWRSNGRGKKP